MAQVATTKDLTLLSQLLHSPSWSTFLTIAEEQGSSSPSPLPSHTLPLTSPLNPQHPPFPRATTPMAAPTLPPTRRRKPLTTDSRSLPMWTCRPSCAAWTTR